VPGNTEGWRWRVPRLRRLLCPPNRLLLDPWITRQAGALGGLVINVGSGEDLRRFGRRTIHVDAHAPSVTVRADLEAALPFRDRTFDAAICSEVLEHVADDGHVIREIARVLKPGGRLIVSVPFAFRYHPDPADFRRYTPVGLRAALERGGFTVEHAAGLGGKIMASLLLIDSIHMAVRVPLRAMLLLARWPLAAASRRDRGWSDYAANSVAIARRISE
jgi:SAM-dependent methyltransferase